MFYASNRRPGLAPVHGLESIEYSEFGVKQRRAWSILRYPIQLMIKRASKLFWLYAVGGVFKQIYIIYVFGKSQSIVLRSFVATCGSNLKLWHLDRPVYCLVIRHFGGIKGIIFTRCLLTNSQNIFYHGSSVGWTLYCWQRITLRTVMTMPKTANPAVWISLRKRRETSR